MGHKTHHHHHQPKAIRLQRPPKNNNNRNDKGQKGKVRIYTYIHMQYEEKFINTDLNKIDKQSQIT